MAKPVPNSTSSKLRADHAIRRAIMAGLPLPKALQRRLQIAFGVDQEVRGDDDLLIFLHAVADFDIAAAAMAELDLARLEPPFALVDKHRLAAAAVEHRAFGNGQHRLRRSGVDFGVDVHVSGRSNSSGFGSSTRTRAVRVCLLISG